MAGRSLEHYQSVERPVEFRAAAGTRFHGIVLGMLFLAGLIVRLYQVGSPPLDFHATRQYRSLEIARAFYYEHAPSVTEKQKQVARINREKQGTLEPPITEMAVSAAYRLWGAEAFWIPRTLSAIFWLQGGGFLYLIALTLFGRHGALVSTAFYLFLPFSITASTSFQPDPLMVMLVLAAVCALLFYDERPTKRNWVVVAVVSALAVLVKPVALFVICGAFFALAVRRRGVRKAMIDRRSVSFLLVALLPSVMFHAYEVIAAGFIRQQVRASFLPQLWLDPFFWTGWILNVRAVIGISAILAAFLGVLLIPPGRARWFLSGMWFGYVTFCFAFEYHVATHDYYHLQLIPIVALSLAPLAALIIERILENQRPWYPRAVLGAVLLLAVAASLYEARFWRTDPRIEKTVRTAQEVGRQVNHSERAVYLDSDYGLPLEYHGELSGHPWPLASDLEWERMTGHQVPDAEARFQSQFSSFAPEYFIVTDLEQYRKQPDLEEFLAARARLLVRDSSYLIYDLQR